MPSKGLSCGLAACALAVALNPVHGELLGISPGFPLTFYNSGGTTTYDADTGLFSVMAMPLATQFEPTMPPRFVNATGMPASRCVLIDIILDADGNLVGGVAGDDFLMTGEIDEDGDGTPDYSGVLLSGEVTEFGFLNTGGPTATGPIGFTGGRRRGDTNTAPGLAPSRFPQNITVNGLPTDLFDFRVEPTGGSFLSTFNGGDIGVDLTAENSTFDDDFGVSFAGGAKGNVGPIDPVTGACCLEDGTCAELSERECAAQGGEYQGDDVDCTPQALGEAGCYRLINGSGTAIDPPPYGLRLDELFDVTPGAPDRFTFDFEAPGAAMFLCYDGMDTVRIFGRAFGGRDVGNDYDPAWTSFIEFDFTYSTVQMAPGDDDLFVNTPAMTNMGTVTWEDTGDVFPLEDALTAGLFAFRFGDDDDDMGFNGFDGFTGLGWLTHPNSLLGGDSDFIFGAIPVCVPTGACCLDGGVCEDLTERECEDRMGEYLGDNTNCMDNECPGACCLPGGGCVEVGATECDNRGGEFFGEGSSCDDVSCPGACCYIDNTGAVACEKISAEECAVLMGIFFGEGSDCANVVCGGACCLDDGTCVSTLNEAECDARGGDFRGLGSDCATEICRDPGACCIPSTLECIITDEDTCRMRMGDYFGDGSECVDSDQDGVPDCFDVCPDGPDDVDCDNDGVPDACEEDCDGNGIPDDCDQFPDCNQNGIPDICEPDCDGDGLPDVCEEDCNNNQIPDDCETGDDCNQNGIPDECEPDCDNDGIPDDCEPDCDNDGIPDDCEDDCDRDGIPDDCEDDCDNDGTPDDCEPDCDNDGTPDDCEPDCDNDGIPDDCEDDCDNDGLPDDCEEDCNSNGRPDDCETGPDCNQNGIPDECEPDCDGDGLPDTCEEDCNNNGLPDDCESFDDCNMNGIPDVCEPDCDGDGIPDDCEEDCNNNRIPDDCETIRDCNQNGVPDECEPDCDNDGIPDECEDDTDMDGIPDDCELGACCIEDDCVIATRADCEAEGGEYQGDGTECTPGSLGGAGTYRLMNHPDANQAPPGYGLRLDELFDVTGDTDVFTFSFDQADGADMKLDYDGNTIRIYGTAFGGRDIGDDYDPAWTSEVEIEFVYNVVSAPGDDDLIAVAPNSGSLTWLDTGEVFDLTDKANDDGLTFRFGDEDDDDGHRGHNGISGWGWLMIGDSDRDGAQDFIFKAIDLCAPPATGACCLRRGYCEELTMAECADRHGDYQGDNVGCDEVSTYFYFDRHATGGDAAGDVKTIKTSYNPNTGRLTWEAVIRPENGVLPDGFTLAINNGPNPNGLPGEMAFFYFDDSGRDNGEDPILCVFVYNGQPGTDGRRSFEDANGDGIPDGGDKIICSPQDDTFIYELRSEYENGRLTLGFDIDTSLINDHMPAFPSGSTYTGAAFDDRVGYWYHTYSELHTEYTNGCLTGWDWDRSGYVDTSNRHTKDLECPRKQSILFVVNDEDNLTNQEAGHRDLFESLGFPVLLLDSADSSTDYDDVLPIVDVAFTPEEIVSGDVGTKLTDAQIGVVNQESWLADELGIAYSTSIQNGNSISVTNSAAYITEGMNGSVQITNNNQPLNRFDDLVPGCDILANTSGQPGLLTMEATSDHGRRVQLPFGASDFDIFQLNDNGVLILERALMWAGGEN